MSGWVYNYVENKKLLAKAKHVFGDELVVSAFLIVEYSADTSADEISEIIDSRISNFNMFENTCARSDELYFDDIDIRIIFSSGAIVDFIGGEFAHLVRR